MRGALAVLSALFLAGSAHAAYCHGAPEPNAPANTLPLVTSAPVLVNETANGKLFVAGPADQPFYIVHVYGDAQQRGTAYGTLLPEGTDDMMNATWNYMIEQAAEGLPFPQWFNDLIVEVGMEAALEITYDLTVQFTDPHFYVEMQAMCTAANIPFYQVRDIHLIGALTQGDCSFVGSWGNATEGGHTVQLRALDWDTGLPFREFHAVLIEHPTDAPNSLASVGFLGWLGGLTGMNSARLAISEIGVAFPDASFGNESYVGIPFTNLLRDILLYDQSVQAATTRIRTANRTCDLILGVGDGNAGYAVGYEYSYSDAAVLTPQNFLPVNSSWHQPLTNTIYWGMDWLCPGYNAALYDQLLQNWGHISIGTMTQDIVAKTQTGSTHVAVYDLTTMQMAVAFLALNDSVAYQNQYTLLDVAALFAEPAPSM